MKAVNTSIGIKRQEQAPSFRPRRFPYPYQAMLAICSDLDETPDKWVYSEISRYLNTSEKTRIDYGLGLEVGNTIYFNMPKGQFSYWNTDDAGRRMILDLIRSGHIDCLHSFGDLAASRTDAAKAIEIMEKHDARLKVWIDHAKAPSNFGSDIMMGLGDVRSSNIYHADLSHAFGIRYVWRGRVTSMIGQNRVPSLKKIMHAKHPKVSLRTVSKEAVKIALGLLGKQKYAMHGSNMILRKACLRDGREIHEFMRCNPHWGGVSCGDNAEGIADVLNRNFLDRLIQRKGFCILYTHLGKITDRKRLFSSETRKAFRLLKQYSDDKTILVTTTRRLLDYCRMMETVKIAFKHDNEGSSIHVSCDMEPHEMDGLTLITNRADKLPLKINGVIVESAKRVHINQKENECITFIPWNSLQYPPLTGLAATRVSVA